MARGLGRKAETRQGNARLHIRPRSTYNTGRILGLHAERIKAEVARGVALAQHEGCIRWLFPAGTGAVHLRKEYGHEEDRRSSLTLRRTEHTVQLACRWAVDSEHWVEDLLDGTAKHTDHSDTAVHHLRLAEAQNLLLGTVVNEAKRIAASQRADEMWIQHADEMSAKMQ